MTRRTALHNLIMIAQAWQINTVQTDMYIFDPFKSLSIQLNWKTIIVIRGKERIEIDPQELFDALKSQK